MMMIQLNYRFGGKSLLWNAFLENEKLLYYPPRDWRNDRIRAQEGMLIEIIFLLNKEIRFKEE